MYYWVIDSEKTQEFLHTTHIPVISVWNSLPRDRVIPTRLGKLYKGVILDPMLSMQAQITTVAWWAFFQVHQVRQLPPYFSRPDLATVIHPMVTPRLDYCN